MPWLTADIDGVQYKVPSYSDRTTTRPFSENYNYMTIKVDDHRNLTVNIGQYGPFRPGDVVEVTASGEVVLNGKPLQSKT
jgi:hypothetical protein